MGSEACDMVRQAVEATLMGNLELVEQVAAMDDRVDQLERSAMNKAVMAVMKESPVATDLRFLVSTLGIVGEIEKIGDQAVKLARRSQRLSGTFPKELRLALKEMGELSRRNLNGALRLYTEYDEELADETIRLDSEVDNAFRDARNRVFELIRQNPDETPNLVRTIEVFHALEHVADHATAIAVRLRMLHHATVD